jgi:hypothetical protein
MESLTLAETIEWYVELDGKGYKEADMSEKWPPDDVLWGLVAAGYDVYHDLDSTFDIHWK